MFRMSGKLVIAAAAVTWSIFAATAANANSVTITPQDDASNLNVVTVTTADPTDIIVGLLCTGGATAECPPNTLVGSLTEATGFAPFSGNPAEEAALLESLVGGNFTAGAKLENPGNSFTIDSAIVHHQARWMDCLLRLV